MKKLILICILLLPVLLFAQNGGQTLYVLKPCNMYSSPSVKSEPVHLLNYYKILRIQSTTNGWVKAEHYDVEGVRHEGYVQRANLTTDREKALKALQKSMTD